MKNLLVSRRLAVTALAAVFSTLALGQVESDSVTLDDARAKVEAGSVLLIDVREPQEHATGVIKGAQLLPMRQLDTRMSEIPNDTKRPVLLICNTQNRSSATLRFLRNKGYVNVHYVQGGMSEWNRRGWPVVKS